jgi:outer membrane protein TolC
VVSAAQTPVTLQQAVDRAIANYPAIRVSNEEAAAAAAGIALARTAYLPRADFLGHVNRATRNNVLGLLLPQSVIPSISGPVLGTNNLTNVWGSAVGFLVSWEPFDFGQRQASVVAAEASRNRANASIVRSKFEVAAMTADAYLTLLAAQQTLQAAKAQVDRSRAVDVIIGALVKAELRPGVDASRNRAELALAQTQVIQAEQAIRVARATLKQLTGADVTPVAGPMLQLPTDLQSAQNVAENPFAKEQEAAVAEAEARRATLDRAYFPRFSLQGSGYARGTGANSDGTTGGALAGIGPNIQNWALGFTVTFSAMDLPSLRVRKEIELHRQLAETAKYDQLLVDLNARLEKAWAALEGARRISGELPAQLEAARAAEQQATARYKSGLASFVDVADAQRVLTQTEIDDSLAKLNVWRAMLSVSAAQGDLQPFLERTK